MSSTLTANTLIVAQSGDPTPVMNASLAGVIHTAQQHPQITHIYGLVNGLEGGVYDNLIDLTLESPDTLDLLSKTPAAILGSGRYKVDAADYDGILDTFLAHNARYFVHIGGSPAMYTTHRLTQIAAARGYNLAVMGVPQAVNNDLVGTDHTPGYGSAARFLALATRDAGRDQEAMGHIEDVTILQTLRGNTGWLAAATVLGKESRAEAPHLVYVPEVAFNEARFFDDLRHIHQRLGRVFVVVAEGLRDATGKVIGPQEDDSCAPESPPSTMGVAVYLAERVRRKVGLEVRVLQPDVIGRAMSATVSSVDRQEARHVGEVAVNQLLGGQQGMMVAIKRVSNDPYHLETRLARLADIAGPEKTMPREFVNSAGTMITPAFVDYALPLIGSPLPPLARLQGERVTQDLSL